MPAAVNGMKECSKCGETKDVSEYGKLKTNKDGLKYACRCCLTIDKKRWRENNREKISADKKRWKKNNREKVLAGKKRHRENNREALAESARKYYEENKEVILDKQKTRSKNAPTAVYEIKNTITGKTYIGQSTNYVNRFLQHKACLRKNTHPNSKLQFDFNRYGEDAFEFSPAYEFPPHTPSRILLEQEKVEIAKRLQRGNELYNSQIPSTELLETNVIEVDFAPEVLNLMVNVCDEEGITFQDMVSIMNIIQERNPNLDVLTKINNFETKEE